MAVGVDKIINHLSKSAVSKIYSLALHADKALTRAVRLPAPVLSVGNIAVGGRAKTPFVIELVRGLLERNWQPVVLTRGYGRKFTAPVWLTGEDLSKCKSEWTGDEALEIFARTGVPVLIGKNRVANAKKYIASNAKADGGAHGQTKKNLVFVLDDGFQHWALKKDFDLLLVKAEDYKDHLLPLGRLRESPSSIWRASMILEQDRDFKKISLLKPVPGILKRDPAAKVVALTTRVSDPAYRSFVQSKYPLAEFLELKDHAPAQKMFEVLASTKADNLLLGAKEAVKILDWETFLKLCLEGSLEWSPKELSPKKFLIQFVECQIENTSQAEMWKRLEDVLRRHG